MNFIFLLFFLLTAGCSTVPPTNVHQPMTARPSPRFDMPSGNGAIYQAANSRPLFEDRRARYVGDTITVKITESTTAYHPQSNGMVERCHRQIKDSLRARLAGACWPEHLPWVLLGLRAAPKEESGISSAEVLFGVPLTLPGQFVAAAEPDVPQLLKQLRDVPVIPLPEASALQSKSDAKEMVLNS